MSRSNLAIVFGPTLLGARREDGELGASVQDTSWQCKAAVEGLDHDDRATHDGITDAPQWRAARGRRGVLGCDWGRGRGTASVLGSGAFAPRDCAERVSCVFEGACPGCQRRGGQQ
ncbi:hypothetical protein AG1IA_10394 [Rhizoctonia solani AG-1 IA]|uniref:Rho-GAP domain-containing protein n=1 Tax=Thanatephorus cucumeris (strain AG1-IA) TaxID=983506 RepID=L8WBM0_THACA|nr:hypothetical protein AG1IA_10394 [Rhizoctonia solani AG-1 IA]